MMLLRDTFVYLAVFGLILQVLTFVIVALRSLWRPKGTVIYPQQQGVTILRPVSGL